jgi:hypothetical protein
MIQEVIERRLHAFIIEEAKHEDIVAPLVVKGFIRSRDVAD